MSRYFLTFGAGGGIYTDAVSKICKQAEKTGLFDHILPMSNITLENEYKDFWTKHKEFIISNKRGFGYYIWKPFIIQQTLKKMKEGDILLYLDSGCDINYNNKHILERLFVEVSKYDMINTRASLERNYTKRDLYDIFEYSNRYLLTVQVQSGIIMLKKVPKIVEFIDEWEHICSDYHNIDDSPSIKPNDSTFKEHRHDQSVYSLLCKKYGYDNYLIDKYNGSNWISSKSSLTSIQRHLSKICIAAYRNRSGICLIDKYINSMRT